VLYNQWSIFYLREGVIQLTFKHGIHPNDNKEFSKDFFFEIMPVGERVYIPLSQHIGKPALPVVQKDDYVKVGSLIGEAQGFISARIHSSISGKVSGIINRPNSNGVMTPHIVIENDFLYNEDFLSPLLDFEQNSIINRVKECGIVGLGGATFPTHVKLMPKNKIKALIINGCECEPYITTDYRLMLEKPSEIMEGIEFVRKALGVNLSYIGIEGNKKDAIYSLAQFSETEVHLFKQLKTKYPQGGEKQLIYSITKEIVPKGGLPSDIGYVVLNISTVYAIYEAVKLGKPCFSRYMTVSGSGIRRPANLFVRNGIPISEIVDYLGEEQGVVKVVLGGPMMGVSLHSYSPVTTKGSSSLLLLKEKEIREIEPTPCINCGRCASVCPMNLLPMMTDKLILKGNTSEANKYYPMSCIECGCCAYVCPARRPLVQSQRLAKKLVNKNKIIPA